MHAVLGEQRVRQRLLEAALALLAERGTLDADLLREAGARAGCPEERARLYFRRAEDLVTALYIRFAIDLEARVAELPRGTVAERFEAILAAKLALVAPYREALAPVVPRVLDPRQEIGALAEATEIIRARVLGIFSAVVLGAADCPADPDLAARLARSLYAAHLLLVLAEQQGHGAGTGMQAVRALLDRAGLGNWNPLAAGSVALLDAIVRPLVERAPDRETNARAESILRRLFRHRRLLPEAGACAEHPCPACLALHLPKVRRFLRTGEPVRFLLPAFPAKSPSPRKVLGTRPDRAEDVALEYLAGVCREIAEVHPPGARILICSDGRVFNDLVGVRDEDVTAYGREIARRSAERYPGLFETFSLEDLFDAPEFAGMREQLAAHYAEPLESLEARAEQFPHHRAMFNGIHRFLVEEYPERDATLSKTKIRERCRPLAYQVIQRSDAWSRLIAECFPTALRLSIHPQDPHGEKIGIRLADAEDAWITPWHGVALRRPDGTFTLVKRSDAENLPGARLVHTPDGRPDYYDCR